MKPFAILATIIFGLASLGLVVWLGQYKGTGLIPSINPPKGTIDEAMPLPKAGPYGKVEIDAIEHKFGAKTVGAIDEHVFAIKNVGEGPLDLKLGKPTCQCTVGEIVKVGSDPSKQDALKTTDQVSLAPGEAVNILVKWVMKAEIDKFHQQVPVFTTDPERRQIDLKITGSVDNPIRLAPLGFWDLGVISKTEPTKGEGIVYSKVLNDFVLTEVPREKSFVKVTLTPADPDALESKEAKCGYKVAVEVGPNIPIGLLLETIKLKAVYGKAEPEAAAGEKPEVASSENSEGDKTEVEKADGEKAEGSNLDPGQSEVFREFTVSARRSGPIDIRGVVGAGFNPTSNRLIFTDFPASEGKKAKLTLFVKGMDEELVLKSVEPADTRFKARIVDGGKVLGNSKSYQIEVEIPPGPAGNHRELKSESIDLMLNHPEAPDLKLILDYNALR